MLEEIIQLEGPHTIAAFFLETVSGTNGVLVPPDGYLEGVRELCTKHGILMVCDEVMAGFGRTGEWFAVNHWNVVPDIITMAKGLTSAYVAMGAVGMRQPIADHFRDKVFQGGLTYNSHPLGCAAALATLRVYEEDDLIGNARRLGPVMARAARGAGRRSTRRSARTARSDCSGWWSSCGIRGPRSRSRRSVKRRRRRGGFGAAAAGGRALHVRPVAHVLHEPAAVRHRGAAPRGVRDDRSRPDEAGVRNDKGLKTAGLQPLSATTCVLSISFLSSAPSTGRPTGRRPRQSSPADTCRPSRRSATRSACPASAPC